VQDHTGGDPMGQGKWVRRSLRALSRELGQREHPACPNTVRRLLRDHDFGLRSNIKRLSGPPHPDREAQFQHIQQQRRAFAEKGLPVLSIDAKKKELIGNFKNAGHAWATQGQEVNTYDFIHQARCRATPFGIYDVNRNCGHVCVGTSADTGAFAVDAVQGWWEAQGRQVYPQADEILILADGGGSNGYRPRLFKRELQRLADTSGLSVTVCHYPTGASKWNPVEHRLFSAISINWAAQPLRSLDTMLNCIRGTHNDGGLTVTARLNDKTYQTQVKVTDREMQGLNLQRHEVCPAWNYTIRPHHALGP
jgi:hypothetical protein